MEILFTGNLGAFSPASYASLAVNHKIIAAGGDLGQNDKKSSVKVFRHAPQDRHFPEAFRMYDLGAVVFFATRPEQGEGEQDGSLESLGIVLSLCDKHKVSKFIYVMSTDLDWRAGAGTEQARANGLNRLLAESGEKMAALYGSQPGRQSYVVRVPYLFGEANKDSLMGRAVLDAAGKRPVTFPGMESQPCDFLHVNDLAALLGRVLEGDVPAGQRDLDAGGGKELTFGDVAALLREQYPECTVSFCSNPGSVPVPASNVMARQYFDWVAMHEFDHDFAAVTAAIAADKPRKPSVMRQVKDLLLGRKWIIQILEILLSFILMEYLITVTGDTLQFKFIDIRLLFVVIIGVIHGLRSGVIAALLACLSIIVAYVSMKMDWRAVVYNVNNWLPFVAYLLTGAVTGYLRDKNDSALEFEKQKSEAQEKHYSFLYELYNQTLEHKDQYKSQLISYRDSFGRVYEMTRRLDHLVPDAIFQQAVQILEDTIGGGSIAIYTVDGAGAYARLAVSSAGLADKLGRSIAVKDYPEMFGALKKDQVWVNRALLEGYPFFCVPVHHGNGLVAVVMAYDVPYDQKSPSGANQFLVICGLIQAALVRAIAYNEATEAQANIPGTRIMVPEKFAELLAIRREMQNTRLAEYSLLRVEGRHDDLASLGERLEQAVRKTDFVGQGADGAIYVLLAQASAGADSPVLKRLESLGLHCTVIETPSAQENSMEDSGDVA